MGGYAQGSGGAHPACDDAEIFLRGGDLELAAEGVGELDLSDFAHALELLELGFGAPDVDGCGAHAVTTSKVSKTTVNLHQGLPESFYFFSWVSCPVCHSIVFEETYQFFLRLP